MNDSSSPRKPLQAVLMSLVLPGYGQLYNGEANKAILLFLGFAFLCVAYALVALYLPDAFLVPVLALGLLLTLLVWLYGMLDAWRVARRSQSYRTKAWQSSGLYLLSLVVCSVIVLPLLIGYVRGHMAESFRIPSASMQPSVLTGDFITADKRYNCPGCKHAIRRGDIAIFTYPNNRTAYYIKRIIGMPGDRVQMKGHEVLINGKSLTVSEVSREGGFEVLEGDGERQWQVRWTGKAEATAQAAASLAAPATSLPAAAVPLQGDADITVPPGQVLVLGDNRNATLDSRAFGTVPMQDVVGRAHQVWFSLDKDGVRWGRLGHVLK